ncbi:MAG: acetyl-CoA acetyltransferase [Corynebacterium sp.]|nr:acetyl-CoA acetyltransferase [Corynebacterium sp.]
MATTTRTRTQRSTQEFRSTTIEFHRDAQREPVGSPIRTTTRFFADDPFRARFGHQLPRGLREEARGMEWRTFTATYAPSSALRIHHIESTKLRGNTYRFDATISDSRSGTRTTTHQEIEATGPISACTNLLADAGRRVEILEFHQFEIFEATVTFIFTCDNNKRAWAMGFGANQELSAAAALNSAAHRLHS